ncbi:MAG: hypothetical protein RIC85_00680 [Gammaproteobacteria bacterium]
MRFKNLEQYRTGGTGSKMELSIPVPKTPDGRVYRFSPNENAHPRHFLLGDVVRDVTVTEAARQRMKQEPRSKRTVCPYSGHVGDDQDFTHPDDIEAAHEMVKHAAFADIQRAMGQAIKGLERSTSRNSFLKIKVKTNEHHRPKPRFGRRDLLRELICDHCGRDYGVYAIGLFCPDCGAPNLRLHFAREAQLVSAQVDLAEAQSAENAELAYRILGNAHEDVLTAFEATQKAVYLYEVDRRGADAPKVKPVKSDFQSLDRARERFAAFDFDPFSDLAGDEFATLSLNIQKRHVIGHNLGVVDAKFAALAVDARLGETVHLVGEDIRSFAALCQKVVDQLDAWLVGTSSPTVGAAPLIVAPDSSGATARASEMSEEDKLDLKLSPLARRVGRWLAENAPNGAHDHFDGSAIEAAFSGVPADELEEAIAELEHDDFIKASHFMGAGLPFVQPTTELFLTFDALVLKTDPTADTRLLTKMILESGEESFRASDLHQQTGWDRRRFNPILSYVTSQIDSDRLSGEIGTEYPTSWFFIIPEDKVTLRRFLKRLER